MSKLKTPIVLLVDKVLDYLEERPYKIVTYAELYLAVWEVPPYAGYKNTIFATINKARTLLDVDCAIHNISNVGYIYVDKGKQC